MTTTETKPATVPVTEFTRTLKNALTFASKDQSSPMIWAVRIWWDDKRVNVESTDRYRLFSEWLAWEGEGVPGEGDVTIYRNEADKLIKKLSASEKNESVHLLTVPGNVHRPDRLIVTTTAYGSAAGDYTGMYPIFVSEGDFIRAHKTTCKIKWGSGARVQPEYRFNREFLADVLTKIDPGDKVTPVQLNFVSGADTATGGNRVGFRFERLNGRSGIDGVIMAVRPPKED